MRHKLCVFILCFSALALLSCTGAKSESNSTEIVIGEFGSLTGTTATFGISTKNGIDMAVDEINKAGGLLGKRGRVIVEDDQSKPEEAQTVATKLVNKDRVVAMIGETASSRSLAAAPVCQNLASLGGFRGCELVAAGPAGPRGVAPLPLWLDGITARQATLWSPGALPRFPR